MDNPKKTNVGFNISREKAKETAGDTFFSFAYDKQGNGEYFAAIIYENGNEHAIMLSHDVIDAYIYGLQDLKQQLELLRL